MTDTKGEGCGITPFLFRGWPKSACYFHDNAYLEKSWHQHNMTRKEVDKAFLAQLLTLAGKSKLKKLASYGMYGVVRLVGGLWWEGKR